MAVYAHLALQNHDITPERYFALTEQEQAFMVASDLIAAQKMKGLGGW